MAVRDSFVTVSVHTGVLQPSLVANKHLVISGKRKTKREQLKGDQLKEATANGGGLSFVYPRGATLGIRRPARAVLSTGAISYPIHRTVCAAWEGKTDKDLPPKSPKPRVVCMGAAEMFADDWLDKEENNSNNKEEDNVESLSDLNLDEDNIIKLSNKGIKNNNHQIETIKNETLIASDCEARPKDVG